MVVKGHVVGLSKLLVLQPAVVLFPLGRVHHLWSQYITFLLISLAPVKGTLANFLWFHLGKTSDIVVLCFSSSSVSSSLEGRAKFLACFMLVNINQKDFSFSNGSDIMSCLCVVYMLFSSHGSRLYVSGDVSQFLNGFLIGQG